MCCIPYVWIYLTCFVCLAACTILIAVTIEYNIDIGKGKLQTTTTTVAPSFASNSTMTDPGAGTFPDGTNLEVNIFVFVVLACH